jgi:anthranilate phosphoribosyltransferase
LAPRLAQLLALRKILGLRNSTHTLVKIMQPFAQPALRLTSYTHPEYAAMLTQYFGTAADPNRGDVFLMRATEGETVANTKKVQQIDWFHAGLKTTLVEAQLGSDSIVAIPPDAHGTAQWIKQVLAGHEQVPQNIAQQVEHCLMAAQQKQGESQ